MGSIVCASPLKYALCLLVNSIREMILHIEDKKQTPRRGLPVERKGSVVIELILILLRNHESLDLLGGSHLKRFICNDRLGDFLMALESLVNL